MRQSLTNPRWPSATRAVLVMGLIACTTLLLPFPVDYPRLLDPDDATQGIFLNDLSFRGHFAASFLGSAEYQDVYRADWAAQRLPYSLLGSGLQRLLDIPPYAVAGLLTALGACFAILGSALASLALTRGRPSGSTTRLAIFGISLAHPSLALLVRTGASFYLFAYALFWGSLYFAIRYAETRRTRDLAGATALVALFIANPYPPILALPPSLVLVFAGLGRLREALRNPRVYTAAGLAVASAVSLTAFLGLWFETSLGAFAGRLLRFHQARSASVSWAQLLDVSPIDKLHKWVDQHFLFLVDGLGDPTRSDTIWTLGSYHSGFLGLLPLMLFGAWFGLRNREPSTRVAGSVLLGFGLVFMTVSFPEGRYTLALVPCYAALAMRGLQEIVRNTQHRRLVTGLILGLLALETQHTIAETYEPSRQHDWAPVAGMREAAPALASFAGEPMGIRWPQRMDYAAGLYFQMVMDPAWRWVDDAPFERMWRRSDTPRLSSVEAPDAARGARLQAAGFRPFAQIQSTAGHEETPLVIWTRAPVRGSFPQEPGPSR